MPIDYATHNDALTGPWLHASGLLARPAMGTSGFSV